MANLAGRKEREKKKKPENIKENTTDLEKWKETKNTGTTQTQVHTDIIDREKKKIGRKEAKTIPPTSKHR